MSKYLSWPKKLKRIIRFIKDYTRKNSVDSAGGSSVFDSGAASPTPSSSSSELDYAISQNGDIQSLYSDDDCQEVVKQILEHEQPIQIAIKLHVTENTYTKWESVSKSSKLYFLC